MIKGCPAVMLRLTALTAARAWQQLLAPCMLLHLPFPPPPPLLLLLKSAALQILALAQCSSQVSVSMPTITPAAHFPAQRPPALICTCCLASHGLANSQTSRPRTLMPALAADAPARHQDPGSLCAQPHPCAPPHQAPSPTQASSSSASASAQAYMPRFQGFDRRSAAEGSDRHATGRSNAACNAARAQAVRQAAEADAARPDQEPLGCRQCARPNCIHNATLDTAHCLMLKLFRDLM